MYIEGNTTRMDMKRTKNTDIMSAVTGSTSKTGVDTSVIDIPKTEIIRLAKGMREDGSHETEQKKREDMWRQARQRVNEYREALAMGSENEEEVMLPLKDADSAYKALQEMGVDIGTYWNSVLRECRLPHGWSLVRMPGDIRQGDLRDHRGRVVATWVYQNRDNSHWGQVYMGTPCYTPYSPHIVHEFVEEECE